MIVATAALVAGALALLGPRVVSALPEPHDPDDDKIPYVTLARARGLAPIGGVVAALAAGSVTWAADQHGAVGAWIVLAVLGVWLSFIDWHTKLLPYRLVMLAYAVVLPLLVTGAWVDGDWRHVLQAGYGMAAVFAFFFASWFLLPRGIGYGDVRLSGLIGASLGYVGLMATLVGVWAGFAVGAVAGLLLVARGRFSRQAFPFGPAMFIGLWIGLVLYV